MPADIATRLEAALAAEAPLNATAPPVDAHVSRETSTPADRPTDRPTGSAQAATGPGRRGSARRSRRRTIVLSTVFTAAALGLGSVLVSSLGDDTKQSEAASMFSGQKVESQVAELLKGQNVEKSPESVEPSVGVQVNPSKSAFGDRRELLIQPTSIPECIIKGIGRTDTSVLGIKQGTYDGTDAYLVVLPAAGDITQVTAYVVDSACTKQRSAPGKVLLTQSYARR
ncbi:hypothetical protein RB628_24075 [Streptomyces sp. ADMS]|uniref:hypothetical protein n=1 Tax=Streptomyces sp. ADMS TaxID=3071415 RepID=UPI00296F4D6A|nr:hypothetical protein [Streptomyces sp. ADMS]MDW4908333.1 hypothetical protein [Streptomyces sp. ADMS]